MKQTLEDAIKALAEKAKKEDVPGGAMQYAQAALNLAHVVATLKNNGTLQ